MRALITGGSGFFGNCLAQFLATRGWRIRVLDHLIPNSSRESRIEFILGDVLDLELVKKAVNDADVIFHCAALVPLSRAGRKFFSVNVEGTRVVLQAALAHRIRKVIHLSSSAVYGLPAGLPVLETSPKIPIDAYGRSNTEAEGVCDEFRRQGLDVTIIRPRPLVGSGRLGIFSVLWDWVRRGQKIYIVGDGSNRFQCLSARDCARLCMLAAQKPCFQEDFNAGASIFETLRQDLEALATHARTSSSIVPVSARLARPAAALLGRLGLLPFVAWHYESLNRDWYFSIEKARELLDWEPEDSNAAMLKAGYDWYLKEGSLVPRDPASIHRAPVRLGLLSLGRGLANLRGKLPDD